jgi:hypothetical protein
MVELAIKDGTFDSQNQKLNKSKITTTAMFDAAINQRLVRIEKGECKHLDLSLSPDELPLERQSTVVAGSVFVDVSKSDRLMWKVKNIYIYETSPKFCVCVCEPPSPFFFFSLSLFLLSVICTMIFYVCIGCSLVLPYRNLSACVCFFFNVLISITLFLVERMFMLFFFSSRNSCRFLQDLKRVVVLILASSITK